MLEEKSNYNFMEVQEVKVMNSQILTNNLLNILIDRNTIYFKKFR